jgi:hypothetical protein
MSELCAGNVRVIALFSIVAAVGFTPNTVVKILIFELESNKGYSTKLGAFVPHCPAEHACVQM